jgi:ketosteroid isomerase-like protein
MRTMRKMLLGLGMSVLAASGCASTGASSRGTVQWDEKAAAEAEATLHKFHRAWDTMDIEAVRAAIADDGFLTTFEINSKNEAVKLSSKEELIQFMNSAFNEFKGQNSTTDARPRVDMVCRATATLAVCTEECDIKVKLADGSSEITPHRGTSILRKGPDGWKFTHWHVSESGPKEVLKADAR